MKTALMGIILLMILAVVCAGCTGQKTVTPATTIATPAPAAASPTAAALPLPANLAGTWQLTTMAIQDGTAVTYPTTAITLYFGSDGTVSGNGGCNNYNGPFVLSGDVTSKGTGIAIGPLSSTKMYCQTTSAQESQYLALLADTVAYNVDGTQLSLTGKEQNVLIYQRPSTIPTMTEGMAPA